MSPARSTALTHREEFEVCQFRAAGLSLTACASYFGVSQRTVKEALAKHQDRLKVVRCAGSGTRRSANARRIGVLAR